MGHGLGCHARLALQSNGSDHARTKDRISRAQPKMTIEVDDVDAVHAKAVGLSLQVVYPLTDEPWGVRWFFVNDPNSVVITVMSHHK